MSWGRRLLPVVLLLALALRLWGIGFGLPFAYARPDETEIAGPAVGFLSGDLRPPFFQWPTLFSYIVALMYAIYGGLAGALTGFASLADFAESRRQNIAPFLLAGRFLSMSMGVVTVWAVYAVGRRVFNEIVGVVAAMFLAVAFLHVRDSHFGVTDVAMTGLVVLAVLAIVRWRDEPGFGRAVVAGAATGLSGSTKYNGLGVGLCFLVALTQVMAPRGPDRLKLGSRSLAGFAAAALLAFAGGSPYIVVDWPRFVRDISAVENTIEAGHGLNLGVGWWYFGTVVLPAGVGWPMWLASLAGAIVLTTTRARQSLPVLVFPLAYYAFAGRGYAVFARYIVPVVPFVCLAAAWFLVYVAGIGTAGVAGAKRWLLFALLVVLVAAPTVLQSVQLDRLLAREDNRLVAAAGVVEAVPEGSVVCQTGAAYGRAPLSLNERSRSYVDCEYDERIGRFSGDAQWVLVQRSPLVLYSPVPAALEQLLREQYTLLASFPAAHPGSDDRLYDQQDAFYLPLRGFTGIQRPGPSFDLYRRRTD